MIRWWRRGVIGGALIRILSGPALAGGAAVVALHSLVRRRLGRIERLGRELGGAGKLVVAARLGIPHVSCGAAHPLDSDTWYYRLDRARKLALVIRFSDGLVRTMSVIRGRFNP